jgi:enterochelin esterase-like enzyme
MKPRLLLLAGILLVACVTAAADDLSGRYSGIISGKKPDGTGPEINLFLILNQRGSKFSCTGGLETFDQGQIPCQEPSVEGNKVKFAMPWGGGVSFDLKANGDALEGAIKSQDGNVNLVPFTRVALKKVADLTLSDRVPILVWEDVNSRSPRMLQLRMDIIDEKTGAMQEFWKSIEKSGAPIIEPAPDSTDSFLVTFVWKGSPDTKNVLVDWPRLANAFPDQFLMSHIEGSDVWFKTMKVRRGARMFYTLSPNDPAGERPEAKWQRKEQADPLNSKRDPDDPSVPLDRARSLLELPGALPQPWYEKRAGVPRYSMVEEKIKSVPLNSERRVLVYTPPGYSKEHAPYPTVYLTDGEDPDGLVFATWTFENLLADGKIPPVVVIRLANPDRPTRGKDLACNAAFLSYLNDEVVPFIRKKYHTSPDPLQTVIGGDSLGGVAASCAGLNYSGTFGLILSQSGAYWYEPTKAEYAEPNWMAQQFIAAKKLPLRFYMDAGTNEIDTSGRGADILLTNRHLRDVLRAKGYDVYYQEFEGDHEFINWRGTLADGLIVLLGHEK